MSKVLDAACFIIDVANEQEEGQISNLSVNKLLYFAQGLSLAKIGKPLFENQIEAWDKGPVIAKIYHAYKKYGESAIPKQNYSTDSLSDEDQDILLEAVARFGKYSANELIRFTHAADGPWALRYRSGMKNVFISQEDIRDYFIKTISVKFYDESKVVNAGIDEFGRVLLPKEIEDAWGGYDAQ